MDLNMEDDCQKCFVLKTEMDKKVTQAEQTNSQQLTAYLMLKQKIISTDKMIREYQSSKAESELLSKKNAEFAQLIDQLHRELSTRSQDCSTLRQEMDPLKKANADFKVELQAAKKEAEKWKYEVDASKHFTNQLVAKVKELEKFEEEVKTLSNKVKEHEKIEKKVKQLKDQNKEAKDTTTKMQKELKKVQKDQKRLTKYALVWAKVADSHNKMNSYQKRFYDKLKSSNNDDEDFDDDDDEDDQADLEETDAQSKLLEKMLADEFESDAQEVPLTPAKTIPTTPKSKRTPVAKTPTRSCRGASSSPRTRSSERNMTPRHTSTTRSKRARLSESVSETSITPMSLGIFELNSHNESETLCNEKEVQDKPSTICSSPRNDEPTREVDPVIDVIQEENGKPEPQLDVTSQSDCGGEEALPRKKRGRPKKSIIQKAPPLLPTRSSESEDLLPHPLPSSNISNANKDFCLPASPKSVEIETTKVDTAQPSTDEPVERQNDEASSAQPEPEVIGSSPPNVECDQPDKKEENEAFTSSVPIEMPDDVIETPAVEQTKDDSSQELLSQVNPSKSPVHQLNIEENIDYVSRDAVEKGAEGKSEGMDSLFFPMDDTLPPPTSSAGKPKESVVIDKIQPEKGEPTTDPCPKNMEYEATDNRPTGLETGSASKPKSPVAIQHSPFIPPTQQFNNSASLLHPTDQAGFKVPRVPPLPDANKNSLPVRPISDPRWTQKFVPASCNEQKDDDELISILKNIRTNIITVPRVVSPLATSPEPVLEPVEPKFRFPVLPRCAFNWSAKKLPITDGLNERLGAYLHPGVTVRVRFRRVGVLKDIRSPDILCCTIRDVVNFAEAERRPRPVVQFHSPPKASTRSEPSFDRQELMVEEQNNTQKRSRNNNIPTLASPRPIENEKCKLPSTFNHPDNYNVKKDKKAHRAAANHNLPQPVKSSKLIQKEMEELPSSGKRSTTVLFGSSSSSSSSSDSESEVTVTISSSVMFPPPEPVKEIPIRPLPSRQPLPFHAAALSLKNRPNRLAIRPIDPSCALVRTTTNRPVISLANQQPTAEILTCSKSVVKTRVLPPPRRSSKDSATPNATVALLEPLLQEVDLPQENVKKRIARSSKRGLGSDSDSSSSEVTPIAKKRKEKEDPQTRPPPSSIVLSPIQVVPKSPLSSSSLTESPTSGVLTRRMAKLGTGTEFVLPSPTPVSSNHPSKVKRVLKNRLAQQSSEPEEIMEASVKEPAAKEQPSKVNAVLFNPVTQKSFEQEKIIKTSVEEFVTKEDKLEKVLASSDASKKRDSQLPQSLPVSFSQSEDDSASSFVYCNPSSPSYDKPSSPPSSPSVTEESKLMEEERKEPSTFELYDTPQSPCNESLIEPTPEKDSLTTVTTVIPTSRVENTEQKLSAFEIISSNSANLPAPAIKHTKKVKASIYSVINKVIKEEQLTAETMATCVERVTWSQNQEHPDVFIRKLMAAIIQNSDALLDLSMTPPAPPLTVAQQRCVALLRAVDLKNKELKVEADYDPNMYCNYFLSEVSHLMFQPMSKLTLAEMNALARTYTAVCRSRGMLQRARVFLFDCLYWLQPRSYSLTYTILSIWTEVLRPASFPFGLTCTDHTIAYLLLNCCRVEAVPGIEGKVLQVRQLFQTVLGYKDVPVKTVDEIVTHLMQRLSETNSVDEATSLSWNLSLLARWEGNAWAISIIEKRLWPFLQKWSAGHSSNAAAAAAISCIGMLAKYATAQQRHGINTVLTALKSILKTGEASAEVEEAVAESIILLGEKDEPQAIIQILKDWKPVNDISDRLQTILHIFFRRQSISVPTV